MCVTILIQHVLTFLMTAYTTCFNNLTIPTNFIASPYIITCIEMKVKVVELEYAQAPKYFKWLLWRQNLCYSYTMVTSGLPAMYTRSPRATGLRAEGVRIRQTTSAHGITVMCHSLSLRRAENSSSQKAC